jgi:hypothetical protein
VTLCEDCRLPHNDTEYCIDAQKAAMLALLNQIGNKGVCRGCGAEIYWVRHKNGKATPYTPAGMNHFLDCPKAKEFKRA